MGQLSRQTLCQRLVEFTKQQDIFNHAESIFMANAEGEMDVAKRELDALGLFKSDLMAFTRYYEFISQIVDFDSRDLEMLSLYARHLAPLLREEMPDDDPIDLSSVDLSHYRLSKTRQQSLKLVKEGASGLYATSDLGTGKPRSKEEVWLSQLIVRLNELFVTNGLTETDLINYAHTIANKVQENESVMSEITNNAPDQVMLGNYPNAVDDAVIDANEANSNQMTQYLNSKDLQQEFQRLMLEFLQPMRGQVGGDA